MRLSTNTSEDLERDEKQRVNADDNRERLAGNTNEAIDDVEAHGVRENANEDVAED